MRAESDLGPVGMMNAVMNAVIKTPKILLSLAMAALATSCSFVQLSDAGAEVAQLDSADIQNCTVVGVVSAATQNRVVLQRGDVKVREELLVLARNQAGELGANAIVPIEQPADGKQSFRAYRC